MVESSYTKLYMMVEEWKVGYKVHHGLSDEECAELIASSELTVTWKALGGGNYQLYIMW